MEDVLASSGILPPFFWLVACSPGEMWDIVESSGRGWCQLMEELGDSEMVWAARGSSLSQRFPGLLDRLVESNDADLLLKLHLAKKEGIPQSEWWKILLFSNWAEPLMPLGAETPQPPLRRATRHQALSWPFAFWSDPALVVLMEKWYPDSFPELGGQGNLKKIQRFRGKYRLACPRRSVVHDGGERYDEEAGSVTHDFELGLSSTTRGRPQRNKA
jgi:hypothetical protein